MAGRERCSRFQCPGLTDNVRQRMCVQPHPLVKATGASHTHPTHAILGRAGPKSILSRVGPLSPSDYGPPLFLSPDIFSRAIAPLGYPPFYS
eukprot:scaffold13712_cov124-Isochrysis_galbana.AAC.1